MASRLAMAIATIRLKEAKVKWLDWMERRFHFLAIPQFPLFIVAANGVIYLMAQVQPNFVERLLLYPDNVRIGEWWRLITFLFVPPLRMNPIFLIFWLLLLYQFSQALENAWGEFRFFIFYLVGAVATALAAFLVLHEPLGNMSLNTTLFLAFATLYPDFELLLFFILPIKVKYLAWFTWFTIIFSFVLGSLSLRVEIAASLANYALFFGEAIWQAARLRWEVYQNRRRMRP
jgi:membrane associated rhomboid family serine protease